MELRQLRYFVAVAEELNFTKAARRMQIAQPPLSRQIRDLEREIGVRLFERNSARVFLTDAGNRFLNEAHTVLRNAARAIEVARQAKNGESGTVRIGIAKGLGEVVSRVINRHLRLLPGVEIDVQDIASGFQSEALVAGRIDVGFLRPPIDTTKLSSEPLFAERFSVVLPRSNPLAKRKQLRLKHLLNQPLLLIDRANLIGSVRQNPRPNIATRGCPPTSSLRRPWFMMKRARFWWIPAKAFISRSVEIPTILLSLIVSPHCR